MASKYPLKLLLSLILKDSNMTLEVETMEKELDTGSHRLPHTDTSVHLQSCCFSAHLEHIKGAYFNARSEAHLCSMRPLMGSRASYTSTASLTQSVGSTRNEETVRRIREKGAEVSFTWQLTPPQEE